MLHTHTPPKEIIVRQALPVGADLSSFTQRKGIEVREDLERDFTGEDVEWIQSDEVMDLG